LTSGGTLKFGDLQDIKVDLKYVHGAFALGILGGVLGAFFVNVNTRLTLLRKRFINTPVKKILETAFFGMLTISMAFMWATKFSTCKEDKQVEEESGEEYI